MKNSRKKIVAIVSIILIALLAAAAVFVSYRLSTQEGLAPTGPASSPAACDAQCPTESDPTLLYSCTPSADGSLVSSCNRAGRVESCGGQNYCCPFVGGNWTTSMTACPTATVTVAPTIAGTGVECSACTSTANCAAGLSCDLVDGRCKKTDGTSVCYEGSAACTVTSTSICVASEAVTCSPDCPTACGNPAGTISTCLDSCGVATTKACPATTACATDIDISKIAYRNEDLSTSRSYEYETAIDTVSKDQTFIYAIYLLNNGEVSVGNIVLTDTLDGDHQDDLTYLDANSGCTFSQSNKKVTCSGISIPAGERVVYAFRVKVNSGAVNGDIIKNTAIAVIGDTSISDDYSVTVSTVVGCNNTCTTDTECSTGLVCDTASSKCRKEACSEDDTCVCPSAVAITEAPTAEPTAVRTVAPVRVATEAPAGAAGVAAGAVEPTILPETGILDFPGVAAFGGGLLLAIVGILLAL